MDIASPITAVKGIGEKHKEHLLKWEYTPLVIYSFISPGLCKVSGNNGY